MTILKIIPIVAGTVFGILFCSDGRGQDVPRTESEEIRLPIITAYPNRDQRAQTAFEKISDLFDQRNWNPDQFVIDPVDESAIKNTLGLSSFRSSAGKVSMQVVTADVQVIPEDIESKNLSPLSRLEVYLNCEQGFRKIQLRIEIPLPEGLGDIEQIVKEGRVAILQEIYARVAVAWLRQLINQHQLIILPDIAKEMGQGEPSFDEQMNLKKLNPGGDPYKVLIATLSSNVAWRDNDLRVRPQQLIWLDRDSEKLKLGQIQIDRLWKRLWIPLESEFAAIRDRQIARQENKNLDEYAKVQTEKVRLALLKGATPDYVGRILLGVSQSFQFLTQRFRRMGARAKYNSTFFEVVPPHLVPDLLMKPAGDPTKLLLGPAPVCRDFI